MTAAAGGGGEWTERLAPALAVGGGGRTVRPMRAGETLLHLSDKRMLLRGGGALALTFAAGGLTVLTVEGQQISTQIVQECVFAAVSTARRSPPKRSCSSYLQRRREPAGRRESSEQTRAAVDVPHRLHPRGLLRSGAA